MIEENIFPPSPVNVEVSLHQLRCALQRLQTVMYQRNYVPNRVDAAMLARLEYNIATFVAGNDEQCSEPSNT